MERLKHLNPTDTHLNPFVLKTQARNITQPGFPALFTLIQSFSKVRLKFKSQLTMMPQIKNRIKNRVQPRSIQLTFTC